MVRALLWASTVPVMPARSLNLSAPLYSHLNRDHLPLSFFLVPYYYEIETLNTAFALLIVKI